MICHANTSSAELIEYLRDVAIRAKAKPAWIDAIDRLQDADKWELEAEEIGGQLHTMKENFNDMRDTLESLLGAVQELIERGDAQEPDECGPWEYLRGEKLDGLCSEATKILTDYPEQAT